MLLSSVKLKEKLLAGDKHEMETPKEVYKCVALP